MYRDRGYRFVRFWSFVVLQPFMGYANSPLRRKQIARALDRVIDAADRRGL